MKKYIITLLTFSSLTVCSWAASPEEETRFKKAVEAAFENQDLKAMTALTCWDRVTKEMRESEEKTNARNLKWGATLIELTDPSPRSPNIAWSKNGVQYKSNLEVTKNIKITFKEGAKYKDVTYFVGEKDGKLRLLAPAPVIKK